MTLLFLRRVVVPSSAVNYHFLLRMRSICSRASAILGKENEKSQSASVDSGQTTSTNYSGGIYLSPLFSDTRAHFDSYNIELVDHDTWQVSSGLANAWRGLDGEMETKSITGVADEGVVDDSSALEDDPDFDDIDNMRIRGNLFYKLDRASKEFEEYNFDFHRKKALKKKDDHEERKKENPSRNVASGGEKLRKVLENGSVIPLIGKMDSSRVGKKKLRTPTFNQLTGPYHEPFCLDLYISKASVRACVVHRVTSKVVAVAHSISKDMKFDLASTRDSTACAAVGAILAQRALADDIHDVVYTPRKGERLEGKLQIVLQSIVANGVNVKVKIKQRRTKKAGLLSTA